MLNRRNPLSTALAFVLMLGMAFAQQAPSAATRMNELGPENSALAQRAGTWDVVETLWNSPGAAPTTIRGVAERRMIRYFLQETLRPVSGADVSRMDYLSFHRIEGRWKYVSMDTRDPVGIMAAWSSGRGEPGTIRITFAPFAVPIPGPVVTGQLLQMDQHIIWQGPNREVKNQYFMPADGSSARWLAHQYAYTRRP